MSEQKRTHDWLNAENPDLDPDNPDLPLAVQETLRAISGWQVPAAESTSEALHRLQQKLKQEENVPFLRQSPEKGEAKRVSLRPWHYALAAAACLALFFVLRTLQPEQAIQLNAPAGELLSFELPDQSSGQLNADSRITYNPHTWDKKRELYLHGEAFFEVRKGATFTVHTEQGAVQVLGTAFNVFVRDSLFEVSCAHGKVAVTSPVDESQSWTLTKGKALRIEGKQSIVLTEKSPEAIASWKAGAFYYENIPFIRVLNELQRQFGVSIVTGDASISQRMYTGFFSKEDLREALNTVSYPMGLTYTLEGNRVRLHKRNE